MAYLERCGCNTRTTLGTNCLVGRGKHCSLRLSHASVSSAHAQIVWRDEAWSLRDLGSRNGTMVFRTADSLTGTLVHAKLPDTTPVVPLHEGVVLEFGAAGERWCFADAGSPRAAARREDGNIVGAEEGTVTLPGEGDQACEITQKPDGRWMMLSPLGQEFVVDQQRIRRADGIWTLELPADLSGTNSTETDNRTAWSVDEVELRISVSHDNENVKLLFAGGGRSRCFDDYKFNDLVHNLADKRLKDQKIDSTHSASEHGWMTKTELARKLGWGNDRRPIAQAVFALRNQLGKAELANHKKVIDDRRGEIRIGVKKLTITFL